MDRKLAGKFEVGKLGIYYLKRIWSSYKLQMANEHDEETVKKEGKYVTAVFNTLGIGLEPTYRYLLNKSPSFEAFEDWILREGIVSAEVINHFNAIIKKEHSPKAKGLSIAQENLVLNEQDLQHWETYGYVVIKQAISPESSAETRAAIYDFIEAKENDAASWYLDHPHKQGIMVQLFNNEAINKNRLSEKIKIAYHQLWNRSDLLVSMDRVSFNPPETESYHFPGPNLHWDVSLKRPIPFGLQGLLYLTDTAADQGAFTLVPGFHNRIDTWLDELPAGENPRETDFTKLNPKPIEGQAGDFIIWHQALPHGSCPNLAKSPRIVQYINYQPIEMKHQKEWI